MSVFDVSAAVMNSHGQPATIKIAGKPKVVTVVFLNEFQQAQLLNVTFEGGTPMCLIKTSDHLNAKSDRDTIQIPGENNNGWFTIRRIEANSKNLSLLKLSTD